MKRESLGLSHDDVFKKIRIRASYLKDIENGDFHLLPDPIYTKNFIKTYAKFLGVDEGPILEDYNAYIRAREEKIVVPQEPSPDEQSFFESVPGKKNYWRLSFVLIVVSLVWLILRLSSPVPEEINTVSKPNIPVAQVNNTDVNSSPALSSTVNQQPVNNSMPPMNKVEKITSGSAVGQPANVNVPVPKNTLLSSDKKQIASSGTQKNNLVIVANQETWIRVKGGENPPVQVLLKPGDKFENNAETFDLDIGNAGGIKLQYKGKYIDNIGKQGDVVHIKLPK